MREYIMKGTSNGWGEYVCELTRCKDCKWYLSNMINSPFDTDGFDRWGGLANCQNGNGLTECSDESYCSEGERRTDG